MRGDELIMLLARPWETEAGDLGRLMNESDPREDRQRRVFGCFALIIYVCPAVHEDTALEAPHSSSSILHKKRSCSQSSTWSAQRSVTAALRERASQDTQP